MFSGIGAFEKALKNLNINYELMGFSEINKWAITSYCAIHNENKEKNMEDITKINPKKVPDCDIITHGSPCQDFSVAGNNKGGDRGSNTRSSLMWYSVNIIKHKLPKYVIWENVKGVLFKNNKHNFEKYLKELKNLGYNNYYKVLNAKNYGIPQNRERIFVISIRKDIDDKSFIFPEPFDSGLRLKDILEKNVDEKYYINNEGAKKLLKNFKNENFQQNLPSIVASRGRNPDNPSDRTTGVFTRQRLEPNTQGITNALTTVQKDNLVLEPSILRYERTEYGKRVRRKYESGEIKEKIGNMRELQPREDGISNTLTTVQKDNLVLEPNKLQFVGGIDSKNWVGDGKKLSRNYPQGNRVYSTDGIACNQTTNGGGLGSTTGLYLEKTNKLQLFTNLSGGKWDKMKDSLRRVYDEKGICPTISTCQGGHREPKVQTQYRIRKLTPLECWRLMGFEDRDYWVARKSLENTYYNGKDRSNSQMYKQAGNSIVVNVLEEIFKNLFKQYI